MRISYRSAIIAAVLIGSCSSSIAQERHEFEHELFSGSQVSDILRAWRTIELQYAPNANLSEFEIRYLEGERSATISFFRPNTIVHSSDEHIIRQDSLYFQVVVDATSARAFQGD